MAKTNKKTFIIVLFLVLIVALGIGYAAFSDTLLISGNANANGNFDLQFTDAQIVTSQGVRLDGTNPTSIAIDTSDNDTVNVNVADLAYPGAGVQFHVEITNVGTAPAVVTGVTPTNATGNSHAIKITGLNNVITTGHDAIQPGGTCSIDFTVEWDPTVEELNSSSGESCSFGLQIEYGQDTSNLFNGTTDHTDVNP